MTKNIFAFILLAFAFTFAEDFEDRIVPDFKIQLPKGDTNFSANRNSEVKKITFNDSVIVIDKTVEKNPTFRISQTNIITQSVSNYGME